MTTRNKAFTGDKKLIAYCGLYCGDCFWREGRVAALARELRSEIKRAGFDNYAWYTARSSAGRVFRDFDRCWAVLGAMTRSGCSKVCREGGCSPKCGIRVCCQTKGIDGCWQCEQVETCHGPKALSPVHKTGHLKNLRLLKRKGPEAFIRGPRYWAMSVRRGASSRATKR